MRFLKLLCIVLMAMLISAAFLACSKSEDISQHVQESESPIPVTPSSDDANPITGLWSGSYAGVDKSVVVYLSFHIKDKGQLDVLNPQKKSIGTGAWTLNGKNFTAVYNIKDAKEVYFFSGELNSLPDGLAGTWGYDSNYKNGGFWNMSKEM